MRLISLKEKQFKSFADKHEQITFHQTKEWADLKAKNGWEAHYVGLDDNTVLRAAAILLAKKMPIINKYLFLSNSALTSSALSSNRRVILSLISMKFVTPKTFNPSRFINALSFKTTTRREP